jgi:hypothetical protein
MTYHGPMIDPQTLHYMDVSWRAIGPLVGVLVGGWITSRNQRRHWFADNKRAEYRELLEQITKCMIESLELSRDPHNRDQMARFHTGLVVATIMIESRLFVSETLRKLKISNRWMEVCVAWTSPEETLDPFKFTDAAQEIMGEIRKVALEDLKKTI